MLNSRSSICITLIILHRMALIQAQRYYYIISGTKKLSIQESDDITSFVGKQLSDLAIDLKSTHIVHSIKVQGEISYFIVLAKNHSFCIYNRSWTTGGIKSKRYTKL